MTRSWGCAMCGDCCERIHINTPRGSITAKLANPYVAGADRRDTQFIDNHMTPTGEVDGAEQGWTPRGVWTCDAFVDRLCSAHNERPRMCSMYPWYADGDNPGDRDRDTYVRTMGERCSYLRDFPTPEGGWLTLGARPLIPLTPA